jgi:hypothetical protein
MKIILVFSFIHVSRIVNMNGCYQSKDYGLFFNLIRLNSIAHLIADDVNLFFLFFSQVEIPLF